MNIKQQIDDLKEMALYQISGYKTGDLDRGYKLVYEEDGDILLMNEYGSYCRLRQSEIVGPSPHDVHPAQQSAREYRTFASKFLWFVKEWEAATAHSGDVIR